MLLDGGFDQPSESRLIREQLVIAASAGTEQESDYTFNEDQCAVYETVNQNLQDTNIGAKLFFVDGPGGPARHIYATLYWKVYIAVGTLNWR